MMINNLGKTLVFINVALSGLFVALAAGIFTHRIDWGWAEPREVYGVRVPSELDKRTAAYVQAGSARRLAEADLQQAARQLDTAQVSWHNYHLWAEPELANYYDKDREIKRVKIDKGDVVLNPNQPGVPALLPDPVVFKYNDGKQDHEIKIEKSLKSYLADLSTLEKELQNLNGDLVQWVEKQKGLTLKLTGEMDPVTKEKKSRGLYELVEEEIARQKSLKEEIKELRPLWAQRLVDAQLLLERRNRLEARLKELEVQVAADEGK